MSRRFLGLCLRSFVWGSEGWNKEVKWNGTVVEDGFFFLKMMGSGPDLLFLLVEAVGLSCLI